MMNFLTGLLFGLIIGVVIGVFIEIFIICVGKLNKEQEAYREGYEDGMANANKGNREVK